RVNSVHPDGIWTPMTAASAPGVDAKYLVFDVKKNPKGRACLPEDVVAMVLFLASDEARAVNGAAMNVDNAILGI
ncbi:MAG TPA: SDR family oxidoreductase, partial [Rubrivivax sp.]|nr:SDR family oxidoreductase [Rubrivivax sp.]